MTQESEEITHAIFLAGGRGKRISGLTTKMGLPKQLLAIKGASSLEHGLEAVSAIYPDTKNIIVSSPLWARLFQQRFPKCQIFVQPQPCGNAEALKIATENIFDGKNVFCFNSDHLFGMTPEELQQLTKIHLLYHFMATILLETTSPTETAKFFWRYDNEHNLKGRSDKSDIQPEMNAGTFVGVFIAQLGWLKTVTAQESKIAAGRHLESKTTDMLLRATSNTRIGVFGTSQKHWGINTPKEYYALQI